MSRIQNGGSEQPYLFDPHGQEELFEIPLDSPSEKLGASRQSEMKKQPEPFTLGWNIGDPIRGGLPKVAIQEARALHNFIDACGGDRWFTDIHKARQILTMLVEKSIEGGGLSVGRSDLKQYGLHQFVSELEVVCIEVAAGKKPINEGMRDCYLSNFIPKFLNELGVIVVEDAPGRWSFRSKGGK